jgi:hypothetical protein
MVAARVEEMVRIPESGTDTDPVDPDAPDDPDTGGDTDDEGGWL